jgi:hypothetical protein
VNGDIERIGLVGDHATKLVSIHPVALFDRELGVLEPDSGQGEQDLEVLAVGNLDLAVTMEDRQVHVLFVAANAGPAGGAPGDRDHPARRR